jgi:type II secretory pathway pseudopilin PulG
MMAMLIVFMVIMGLLLLKVQPYARAEVMRDREAELVFRGEAIARAIKLFQLRTGRYPTALEELQTVRPRIIRRIYKDPMTKDGEWRKIYAVQPGASGDTTGLPLVGVASKSDEDRTYRVYRGKTLYSDWIFSSVDTVIGLPGAPKLPSIQPLLDAGKGSPGPLEGAGGKR